MKTNVNAKPNLKTPSISNNIASGFHYLWFLTLSYTVAILLANWFDCRFIVLFGFNTDAGTLIYPLTFVLSDLITEVYGYKHARRAIWAGLLFNLIYIGYSQIIIHLPSPSFAHLNPMIDKILEFNTRIIVASIVSYLLCEPINSYILAKLKIKMQGNYIALRFVVSTLCAAGLDSLLFCVIAFWHVMPTPQLIEFIIVLWLIKIMIEIIVLPISIFLVKKLKQQEQLDIYDKNTNFSLWRWDIHYQTSDNFFDVSK
ncbi:MAG: queuosine precursor transporter [Legionellales bacterium]|nr:queuosine precursor transporter [Legionellales bacterium]